MNARPLHVNFHANVNVQRTIKPAQFKITKTDTVGKGEERLLETSYDYGQTFY